MTQKSDSYGCLAAVIIFIALIVGLIWSLGNRGKIPELAKWFEKEEPLLASLPNPPFGNMSVLKARCLIVARDVDRFGDVDMFTQEHFDLTFTDRHSHICYPDGPEDGVDLRSIDYIVFLRSGPKEFVKTPNGQTIYYRVDPITGKKMEVGREPYPGFWAVHDEDVFVLRRDNHACVLARHVKAGSLKKLLDDLQLSLVQYHFEDVHP